MAAAPSPPSWRDALDLMQRLAEDDLAATGAAPTLLLAYQGARPLAAITLRPFDRDEGVSEPLLQAVALVVPAGADRLAFCSSARAWSLDDPIVPVSAEGDLRQRVLVVLQVDGARRTPPKVRSRVVPFDIDHAGKVAWQPPLQLGPPEHGEVVSLLLGGIQQRHQLRSYDEVAIGRQALRLLALGHTLMLPPDDTGGRGRIAAAVAAAVDDLDVDAATLALLDAATGGVLGAMLA